jgi:hypothetical protein
MTFRNPGLAKAFVSGAAINGSRIVKFGADENTVIQGAAATDSLIGVVDLVGCDNAERIDVFLEGVVTVEFGGTVTRGALLTSDSVGRAVAAAPAAGANNRTIGIALVDAVSGDKSSMLLSPGSIQGA